MLVLSRKSGESIEIGDRVIVHVLAARGSKVQLGIDAPREVSIRRSERAVQRSDREVVHRGVGVKGRTHEDSRPAPRPITEASGPSCAGMLADDVGASFPGASSLGNGVLHDLALAQTEVAMLAEVASEPDRTMARQVASKAIERLTAIERALRVLTRQSFERPIAAFVESRSERLQQAGTNSPETRVGSGKLARKGELARNRDGDSSTTLVREPVSDYRLVPLT